MYHGEMDFDTFYRRYCETILGIDDSIGKIMHTLVTQKLTGSTILFYMGDNGFCFGEHGLIDKRQMYEPSIRVPLLAWAPGFLKAGFTITENVRNIDIAPTVMDYAGLKPTDGMDGRSFAPLLAGERITWPNEFFYEYYWERAFPHTPTMLGIRTDRYKYITYHGIWDIDELYDLSNDPHEMVNLIKNPEYNDLIIQLRKQIFDWLEETGGMKIPLKRSSLWQANKRKPIEK
jgi:N-acetylglucosamine-6-sulfatase